MHVKRIAERAICWALVETTLQAGFQISISAEAFPSAISEDAEAILKTMFESDDLWLRVHKDNLAKHIGWVRIVFGNDGWDVISDYTTNLEDLLSPVLAFSRLFEPGEDEIVMPSFFATIWAQHRKDASADQTKKHPKCSNCGSLNVTSDAFAQWDVETQAWKLTSLLDNTDCQDCGDECQIEWVEISSPNFG